MGVVNVRMMMSHGSCSDDVSFVVGSRSATAVLGQQTSYERGAINTMNAQDVVMLSKSRNLQSRVMRE